MPEAIKLENGKYSRAAIRTFTDRPTFLYKTLLVFNINPKELLQIN
jgi:hypothetical protein